MYADDASSQSVTMVHELLERPPVAMVALSGEHNFYSLAFVR